MKSKIDYNSMISRMISEIDALKGETRAEIILLQAHVEFMVDEILEVLIETNSMRGIKSGLRKKLEILKDLDWLSQETVNDIRILAKIRGFMAHSLDVYDLKTREGMEREFKQIQLIQRADKVFFPIGESIQKHLNTVMQIYMRALYDVYERVYAVKESTSLKNPKPSRSNWYFKADSDNKSVKISRVE